MSLNFTEYLFNRWCTIFVMWFLMSLALFEAPSVPGLSLPFWATMIMEAFCLSFIMFRMKQIWSFVQRQEFLRDAKNIVVCCCVLVRQHYLVEYIVIYETYMCLIYFKLKIAVYKEPILLDKKMPT